MSMTAQGAPASDPNFNPHEAAAHIGVSKKTLQRWRKDGKGPAYTTIAASIIRYRKSAVDEWLAERIRYAVLDCVADWKTDGLGGETRADRHAAWNRDADVDEVMANTGCNRRSAEEAIDRLSVGHGPYDDGQEFNPDERHGPIKPSDEMPGLYSAFNGLSPQLRHFDRVSELIDRLARTENATYKPIKSRDRYKTKTSPRERAAIAAKMSHYPECRIESELWSWSKQGAGVRSAKQSKEWQRRDWAPYEEPKREMGHGRERDKRPKARSVFVPADFIVGNRSSGAAGLHVNL
jgi:predicted DNA-binding transcriptional regulator AlpA